MEKVLFGMSSNWETYLLAIVVFLCGFSFYGLFYNAPPSSNKVIAFLCKLIKPAAFIQLTVIIVTLITLLVSAFIETFRNHPISKDPQHWGQMGDFFGGMLNPILAFASFLALLYTIRIQSATQHEATANAKADRALSILIPEYHRHEQYMTGLISEAENLWDVTFQLEGEEDCSIRILVRSAFLTSINKHENTGKTKIRHSLQDIGDLINDRLHGENPVAFRVVNNYFLTVLSIKRASTDILQVTKRIEALNDVPLFRDKYQSIALHLITAELLSKSAICFNRYGTSVGYLGGVDEQIQKEINRMATESFNLTIDTP